MNAQMKPVWIIIFGALLGMNLFTFLLMRHDKLCARNGQRRVPEKTLFLFAALFGAFGGTLGMFVFRHKTKHWYFRALFPVMLVLQTAILGYLWSRGII